MDDENFELTTTRLSQLAAILARSGESAEEAVDRAAKIWEEASYYIFDREVVRRPEERRKGDEWLALFPPEERISLAEAFKRQRELPKPRYKSEGGLARALARHGLLMHDKVT